MLGLVLGVISHLLGKRGKSFAGSPLAGLNTGGARGSTPLTRLQEMSRFLDASRTQARQRSACKEASAEITRRSEMEPKPECLNCGEYAEDCVCGHTRTE